MWAILIVVPCVVGLRQLPAIDNGAAAPVLLLAVLVSARTWGTGPALCTAVTATMGYSYFFLSAIGFALKDPADWAAFITFTFDALTHNLRTPLTAIKASVTALLDARDWNEKEALSREGREELLEVINEESDRLNRFIEGLSEADRPERSQPLSLRAVKLEDIVLAALTRAETVTRDHQTVLLLDESIPTLSVDAAAVVEVLYILLDNASKYSPAGTRIRLHALVDDGRLARIEVSDEGPGIPAALQERVFEKFFRVPGR